MLALKLDHVSKQYVVQQENTGSLLQRLRKSFTSPPPFLAVNDMSFEVPSGQALGIIGHNGAGKSTLLKLLSGITTPSHGTITIHGHIAGLLEVGSGFHPELTGRENIFLSGTILGMKRRDIHERLESIIDFSEVRRFIDLPVKRYSSGMYVRLGFAIAAHLNPDILLLDEVLAVGDASFQKKCIDRVLALKKAGVTIIFISHDLQAVIKLCDRVLVMQRGQLTFDGNPASAVSAYASSSEQGTRKSAYAPDGQPWAEITAVELTDRSGQPADHFQTGDPLVARVHYRAHQTIEDARVDVYFNGSSGDLQFQFCTLFSGQKLTLPQGTGIVEFETAELGLQPGVFRIDSSLAQHGIPDPLDWQVGCRSIHVSGGRLFGAFYHAHTWRHLDTTATKERLIR